MSRVKTEKFLKPAVMLILLLCLAAFGCPVYELFGVLCPCCGVTRAWVAFLHGDILRAFQYHALFPAIPAIGVLYVYGCYSSKPLHKWTIIAMVGMALLVFVYGVLRWLGFVVIP